MKLAEALQERADLNRKIEQLRSRITANALVQEGEEPAEDPNELLKELESACDRLIELVAAINRTNTETKADGKTLTEIIAEKDVLSVKAACYRDLVSSASDRVQRYTRTEIKILSTVNVKEIQKKADRISQRIRQLDNALQAANWTTELME